MDSNNTSNSSNNLSKEQVIQNIKAQEQNFVNSLPVAQRQEAINHLDKFQKSYQYNSQDVTKYERQNSRFSRRRN